MHPNTAKRTKKGVYGPMGWIGYVRCEKFQHEFVARTFELIAVVQPILHRVSCNNKTIPNAPKHYEMHQNMGLGSNGVDRVRSFRKIPTRLCGTNFCINYTSPAQFCSKFGAAMKRSQMHTNTKKRAKTWV